MTTQGSYDIVLKDRHGNSISSPSVASGNIIITPPPGATTTTASSSSSASATASATSSNAQTQPRAAEVQTLLQEYTERKQALSSPAQTPDPEPDATRHQNGDVGGVEVVRNSERIVVQQDTAVPVIQPQQPQQPQQQQGNKDRIKTTDLGMDLSGKHLVKAHGPKDPDYVNVKYVRTDGDHILDPDYVNVRYLRKNGDQILQFEDNGMEICNSAQTPDKELIRIQAHEMTIEKSPGDKTWFGSSQQKSEGSFQTVESSTTKASESSVPSAVNANPKSRSSSESSLPGNPRKPRPNSFPNSQSSQNRRSVEAPLASMAEFDLGEGNQLYFDPERPEEAAKDAQPVPKYSMDSAGDKPPSAKVQQISQGPRINVVLPERRSKLEMSPDLMAEELERTIREKTKLEGQLEVCATVPRNNNTYNNGTLL